MHARATRAASSSSSSPSPLLKISLAVYILARARIFVSEGSDMKRIEKKERARRAVKVDRREFIGTAATNDTCLEASLPIASNPSGIYLGGRRASHASPRDLAPPRASSLSRTGK